MTIKVGVSLLHWNYYLALETDLAQVSRFIEFTDKNFNTYSIELAHLLLAASSEVDVIAKAICLHCAPGVSAESINDYRTVICAHIPDFPLQVIHVPRFGLTLGPWSNWSRGVNPDWWQGYNNVKHHRDAHFSDANLKNALHALGALHLVAFHYYRLKANLDLSPYGKKDTTNFLKPESQLLRLGDDFYYENVYS